MTKEQKQSAINDLSEKLDSNGVIYITDISELDALTTSALRRQCHAKDVGKHVLAFRPFHNYDHTIGMFNIHKCRQGYLIPFGGEYGI